MPNYVYTAKNSNNDEICSYSSKKNADTLLSALQTENFHEIKIFETRTARKKISQIEHANLCRSLEVVFTSNVSLLEGMLLVSKESKKNLSFALTEIVDILKEGIFFSKAFELYAHIFDKYMITMIKVGEASGTLDLVFADLADFFETSSYYQSVRKSAFPYGKMIFFGLIFLVYITALSFVSKQFVSLPALSFDLLFAANLKVLKTLTLIALMATIFFTILIYTLHQNKLLRLHMDRLKCFLHSGKNSIEKDMLSIKFINLMLITLNSGISFSYSLKFVSGISDNKYVEALLTDLQSSNKNFDDSDLVQNLRNLDVFSEKFMSSLALAVKTNSLDKMLRHSNRLLNAEMKKKIEQKAFKAEIIFLIALTLTVCLLILTFILPMIKFIYTL